MTELPLVSIGVPVRNEEKFLKESLEALLAQDYPNVEILISDNASDDGTSIIAKHFAKTHPNVTYHRFSTNVGPAENFRKVLLDANGRYFMWAAGHDLWSRNYISACVFELERNNSAVLAIGTGQWIDSEGDVMDRRSGWTDTRGMDVISRYITILWGNMHPILGVIRRDMLADCQLINTVGTDLIILTKLILQGDFLHAVDASWSRREFRNESRYQDKLKRYKSSSYRLSGSGLANAFPLARLPMELIRNIIKSRQPVWVRTLIILLLLPSLPGRYIAGIYKPGNMCP